MYILFDIGGTTTRVTVSNNRKNFAKPVVYRTPKRYAQALREFVNAIQKLSAGKKILGVYGGVPGIVGGNGKLSGAINLPDYEGKFIVKDLSKLCKAKAHIQNDAAMAGLGEIFYGAGTAKGVCAYITVSSGVGGKRFVNGKVDPSDGRFEPGKQILLFEEGKGVAGITLEGLVSGRSIFERYGKKPSDVHDKKLWDYEAKMLAVGLLNTSVHWRPNVIVLGGGIIRTTDIEVSKVSAYMKKFATNRVLLPAIKKARLGDFGGLYGALAVLSKKA